MRVVKFLAKWIGIYLGSQLVAGVFVGGGVGGSVVSALIMGGFIVYYAVLQRHIRRPIPSPMNPLGPRSAKEHPVLAWWADPERPWVIRASFVPGTLLLVLLFALLVNALIGGDPTPWSRIGR